MSCGESHLFAAFNGSITRLKLYSNQKHTHG